jgi:hypothetical protein
MRRIAASFAALLLFSLSGRAAAWTINGAPIAPSDSAQSELVALPDGAGGAYFAFQNQRGTTRDLIVQRLDANGARSGGWPVAGVLALPGVTSPYYPYRHTQMVNGGANGVYVATGLFRSNENENGPLARLTPAGAVPAGWPVNIVFDFGDSYYSAESPLVLGDDAAGGVFVEHAFSQFTPAAMISGTNTVATMIQGPSFAVKSPTDGGVVPFCWAMSIVAMNMPRFGTPYRFNF